jgi:hypothetical protein
MGIFMSLPPQIDQIVRSRFETLLSESERLLQKMMSHDERGGYVEERIGLWVSPPSISEVEFYSFRTKFLSLLSFISTGNSHLENMGKEAALLHESIHNMKVLRGFLVGTNDDYRAGLLENLSQHMQANIANDYLGQAEQLLHEGGTGQYNHVPAAVLTGAILEDALRRLCQRQNPPISTSKDNGDPKTMGTLIEDLKKANLFNELKAKQLRSWADVRNAAAHGRFDDFARQDVEQMLTGVQKFLADYL